MTHEEAIKAIQREIECVKRQGKTGECCRDELGCGACDLVFEDEWILEAYGMAIHALEAENNGDITPKEALDATARLVDRVLEILPNIMQSVIDAMPDAIEKYLKEREMHEDWID